MIRSWSSFQRRLKRRSAGESDAANNSGCGDPFHGPRSGGLSRVEAVTHNKPAYTDGGMANGVGRVTAHAHTYRDDGIHAAKNWPQSHVLKFLIFGPHSPPWVSWNRSHFEVSAFRVRMFKKSNSPTAFPSGESCWHRTAKFLVFCFKLDWTLGHVNAGSISAHGSFRA
jgi:hypothetical protein